MQKNRELLPGVTPEVLEQFTSRFFNRRDWYAVQRADGHYTAKHTPVTPDLIASHIQGAVTVGTYCLSQENTAQWVVIDADSREQWAHLLTLARAVPIPVYLEQSRRGGHAWVFLETPISGSEARQFAKLLLQDYQFPTVEVYPKQDKLSDGPGSLVRLPFGFHRKVHVPGQPGKRFLFQTIDGQPFASTIHEQIALLAIADRVPQAFITHLRAELSPSEPTSLSSRPFITRDIDTEMPLSERLKARIGVSEFVSHYVSLDEYGRGFCPFHEDTHMSFGVNRHRNYWHCFAGCGGGSIIDFWMKWRGRAGQENSFTATITDLADILQL